MHLFIRPAAGAWDAASPERLALRAPGTCWSAGSSVQSQARSSAPAPLTHLLPVLGFPVQPQPQLPLVPPRLPAPARALSSQES